jgi:hypothetical protein
VIEGLDAGEWFMTAPFANESLKSDYTLQMQKEFCASEYSNGHIGGGKGPCVVPTARQRDTPTLGNALLQWNSSSDVAARSYRYDRFLSATVVNAITKLSAAVKETSGHAAFVFAFYGYVLDLSDTRLTGSGHLDLASLLTVPSVDAVASPYSYTGSCGV